MKKLIVSIGAAVLMFCASGVFAQSGEQVNPVAKGNLVVKLFDMGYAGFDSGDFYSEIDGETIGINDVLHPYAFYYPLGAEVNYFIIEGLAIGGSLHYSRHAVPNGGDIDMIMWSVGPSLFYYMNINGSILPFITISYIYSNMKFSDDSIDMTLKRIPVGAGVVYMAGKYIGVFGQISYSFDEFSQKNKDSESGSMASLNAGVKVFF